MKLKFRKLDENNEEDVVQFNELMDDLTIHAKNKRLLMEKIKEINSCEHSFLMIAEDIEKSKICGSLLAIIFGDFCGECRPIMLIENVIVHHTYRRKGIGKKMFCEIEKWGKNRDINYVILCSGLNRKEAHEFYNHIGYEEMKGLKKYL